LMLPWLASGKTEAGRPDETPENTPKPKKKAARGTPPGRNPLPDKLERVPLYNAVPPALRVCPHCGFAMQQMGHTSCEYLDVIPAKVIVVHRIDEAVKCPID